MTLVGPGQEVHYEQIWDIQIPAECITEREGNVNSVRVSTLLYGLRDAVRVPGVADSFVRMLQDPLPRMHVATTRVPSFGNGHEDPTLGYRYLGPLQHIPFQWQPVYQFADRRFEVLSMEDPNVFDSCRRFMRTWRIFHLEPHYNFILIFSNADRSPWSSTFVSQIVPSPSPFHFHRGLPSPRLNDIHRGNAPSVEGVLGIRVHTPNRAHNPIRTHSPHTRHSPLTRNHSPLSRTQSTSALDMSSMHIAERGSPLSRRSVAISQQPVPWALGLQMNQSNLGDIRREVQIKSPQAHVPLAHGFINANLSFSDPIVYQDNQNGSPTGFLNLDSPRTSNLENPLSSYFSDATCQNIQNGTPAAYANIESSIAHPISPSVNQETQHGPPAGSLDTAAPNVEFPGAVNHTSSPSNIAIAPDQCDSPVGLTDSPATDPDSYLPSPVNPEVEDFEANGDAANGISDSLFASLSPGMTLEDVCKHLQIEALYNAAKFVKVFNKFVLHVDNCDAVIELLKKLRLVRPNSEPQINSVVTYPGGLKISVGNVLSQLHWKWRTFKQKYDSFQWGTKLAKDMEWAGGDVMSMSCFADM